MSFMEGRPNGDNSVDRYLKWEVVPLFSPLRPRTGNGSVFATRSPAIGLDYVIMHDDDQKIEMNYVELLKVDFYFTRKRILKTENIKRNSNIRINTILHQHLSIILSSGQFQFFFNNFYIFKRRKWFNLFFLLISIQF